MWTKIKYSGEMNLKDWGMPLIILFVSLSSFGLGRLSVLGEYRDEIHFVQTGKVKNPSGLYPEGLVVGSQSTHIYYAPWCKGVDKLVAGDIRWFANEIDALTAHFVPAKGCIGLGN